MTANAAHKQKIRSNVKEFLIFLSVPVTIILLVAVLVIGPDFFAKPKYDFIYSYCPSYDCSGGFSVNNQGEITESTRSSTSDSSATAADLYYFNAAKGSYKKIDLASARSYKLNSSNISPDGYALIHNSADGGFFFIGGYSDNWYLKNGLKKKQVNLYENNSYSDDLKFIGWVQK
jgi:hypothetical protein